MGTTAEKLTYLNTTKQLIKESINLTDANITTQPFRQYATILKHRLPEIVGNPSIIWNNYEHVTGSGTSFSITAYNSIIDYSLKGDTTQNGTPTPDAPVPVNTVTGDQVISVNSTQYPIYLGVENLFDKDNANYVNGWIDGTTMRLNTINGNRMFYIPCKPNTTYTISRSVITSSFRTTTYDSTPFPTVTDSNVDYTVSSVLKNDSGTTLTITTGANAKYLVVHYGKIEDTNLNETLATIQVKYDNKANPYTPYGVTPIELCKIGTYQDYIYKDNGSWYLHKEIGKVVLDGSENWQSAGTNPQKWSLAKSDYKYVEENICFSNYFRSVVNGPVGTITNNQIKFRYHSDQAKWLYICDTSFSTVTDFKAWLSAHNTIVYYVLATPTNTEITDGHLINQLNAVSLVTGLNNISISGNLPAILNLTAIKYA